MSTGNCINAATGLGASSPALGNIHSASAVSMGATGVGTAISSTSSPEGKQRVETNAADSGFSFTDRNQLFMIGIGLIGIYIAYNASKS